MRPSVTGVAAMLLSMSLPFAACGGQADGPRRLMLDLPPEALALEPGTQPVHVYRDWDGLKRDTYYFLAGQFLIIAALYAGPESISGWSQEQKDEYSFDRYRRNIGDITVDEDRWWVNYVLHPYWGGAYYVRARERGYSDDEAFWYSALLSTLFEYGPESLFEQPSAQDLIFTPVLGYFVGGYFMGLRDGIRSRAAAGQQPGLGERTLMVLTDPLGTASGLIDGLLGIDGELTVAPFFVSLPAVALTGEGPPVRAGEAELLPGMQLYLTW